MRIALIGRTKLLVSAALHLRDAGHEIVVVWTAPPESVYSATAKDFQNLAASLGAKYMEWPDTKMADGIKALEASGCDVAVSINWPVLLPLEIITLFPFGVLNAHAGDLPRYRGNACPNWAILNGENSVALTIHQMDEGLDSGPIVLKKKMPIDESTYIGDIYSWLEETIPQAFLQSVSLFQDLNFSPREQSTESADTLRTYPRRPSDGLIDWGADAREVHRLVRASSRPFDGAYTFLEGGVRIVVWRAECVASPSPFNAIPGQVCHGIAGDPVIACGAGLLRLTDISTAGLDHARTSSLVLSSLRNRLTAVAIPEAGE